SNWDAGGTPAPLDSRWGTSTPLGGAAAPPLLPSSASAPLQVHGYSLDIF
ncbi:hypothetical protein TorRG33x02_303370, partial [Trema orientale]